MNYGTRHFAKQAVCLYLVFTLLLSGCSGRYGRILTPVENRSEVSKVHNEFSKLASRSDLPIMYVSEGKKGVSRVEAALEAADSHDIQARANLNREYADLNARRLEIQAKTNNDLFHAQSLREKYTKEHGKAMAEINSRESELTALIGRKDTIINSLGKEGSSKCKDIIATAREKLASELAKVEQGTEIYAAIEIEGNATIMGMQEASRATRERASATVMELNAQAVAVKLETPALASELQEQIKSTKIQTASESERLRVQSETLLKNALAKVKELRSKGSTIEENLGNEEYQLQLAQAESTKVQSQAKAEETSAGAPTRFDKAMAEIDLLRSETNLHQQTAKAAYESSLAEVVAKYENESSEVKKLRAKADRAENVARAEFIKAEASARAEAVRQTAIHAETVADAQELEIIAAAHAEAARVKQEVLNEIAFKKMTGKVEMAKRTKALSQQPDGLHEVPESIKVKPVAARIEPDHIAEFRASFAGVMRVRANADNYELVAEASYAEAKTSLLAVKTQEDAIASEQFSISDALEAQARSRFAELETKTAKKMEVVESTFDQQVVQAESFRKEKIAESLDYYSQADALEQIATARADQLISESDAVVVCGDNDVKELEINLWAIQERGDAMYSKLVTEAKSITDSQEALALQIDAQIATAGKCLEAELAKLDNSLKSSERIAKADYQQALGKASVLRLNTEAQVSRASAQFAMEHTTLKAQIDRDKELALSYVMRSEATCDRLVADATTNRICLNADIDAKQSTVQADTDIALASNASKRESAQAYLDAVKARFQARVHQVQAERVMDLADQYNLAAIKRTDLATTLAEAMAAREDSSKKLTALAKRQNDLQTASMTNWSQRLAIYKDAGSNGDNIDIGDLNDQLKATPTSVTNYLSTTAY